MHLDVYNSVIDRMNKVLGEVETDTGVIISIPIRSFVRDIVLESLQLRNDEWQKVGLNAANAGDADRIATHIVAVVKDVVFDVSTYAPIMGRKRALLIGVVQRIHERWCGVFPFCR